MLEQSLIDSYCETGDPSAAFREIVDRHGPAVHRTCQRLLQDSHAAEDAFQATFLVLVQRNPRLCDPDRLGHWLVGVARRVCLRLRSRGLRQSDRERSWASMQPMALEQDWPLLEIRKAVREELDQLPERYRLPLALCYLEGLTHEEAADRLDCPVGTVKTQLVRARRLLKDRLDRRGLGLAVAFLLFLLRGESEASASYELLANSTVDAMMMAADGENLALQALYPRAMELSRKLIATRFASFRFARFLLILALAGLATGGVALARQIQTVRVEALESSAKLSGVLDKDCR